MSAQGDVLVEAHRRAQTQLSLVTAAAMLRLWPLLRADDVDGSTERWLSLVLLVVRTQWAQSALLANSYLTAHRTIELGVGVPTLRLPPVPVMDERQVITSMMTLGPVRVRQEIAKVIAKAQISKVGDGGAPPLNPTIPSGLRIPLAKDQAIARAVAGSAVRHARNGGRDAIDNAIKNDQRVIGYVRVTDGSPCFFCAMIASRGPVYQEDSFEDSYPRFHGPGDQKVHDSCGCDLKPLYRRDSADLAESNRYSDLWTQASKGRSGKDAVRQFRQIYAGRDPQVSTS